MQLQGIATLDQTGRNFGSGMEQRFHNNERILLLLATEKCAQEFPKVIKRSTRTRDKAIKYIPSVSAYVGEFPLSGHLFHPSLPHSLPASK